MKTYIILGMGRSGTSFLTHALHAQGVNMGRQFKGGRNPTGGYENIEFESLNRKIITEAGGKWGIGAIPIEEEKILEQEAKFQEEIRQVIENNKDTLWGWKDPKTTLTIRLYMPHVLAVDDDPFIYACFRKPQKVAQSLYQRSGNERDKTIGIRVAKEYNRRLLKFLKDFLELED